MPAHSLKAGLTNGYLPVIYDEREQHAAATNVRDDSVRQQTPAVHCSGEYHPSENRW